MAWFEYRYLSERKIVGFDTYKYSSVDTSPIAVYISHPFWNWLVQFFPLWIAPNALTLAGFLMVQGGLLLVTCLDYELYGADQIHGYKPLPNWVWLALAICTFLAHTLDGVDGKQARRTGTSGPTGELFDHGLDSWSTVPFTITLFSIFGRLEYSLPCIDLLCILISVQLVFIATHWEKYNTGILFLSWGYDLSQYGLSLMYLATWVTGYQFWRFYFISSIHLSFAKVLAVGFYLTCGMSVVMSLYNIYHCYFVTKNGKQKNFFEVFRPMVPFFTLSAMSLIWAKYSRTLVINTDPRAFYWLNGTLFSNIASRLIIAQMTSTRAQIGNLLLVPFVMVASVCCVVNVTPFVELWLLRAMAVGITIAHTHYGICVVNQLCNHFSIRAFSISHRIKSAESISKAE